MEDPKVKKYLALLLALVMVFALAACGSTAETPAATEAPAAEPETPAEEPAAEADPMEDLIAAATADVASPALVTSSATLSRFACGPTAVLTLAGSRPVATTECPAASAAFAISTPRPRLAPVIRMWVCIAPP